MTRLGSLTGTKKPVIVWKSCESTVFNKNVTNVGLGINVVVVVI